MQDPASSPGRQDDLSRVEIEAQVDPDRPDGDRYITPKPAVGRMSVKSRSLARGNTLPASTNPVACNGPSTAMRSSLLNTTTPLPPVGKTCWRDGLLVAETVEREATHGRITAGEEALTGRQVLNDHAVKRARKPMGKADTGTERHDNATLHGRR